MIAAALPSGAARADTDLTVGQVVFHQDDRFISLGNDLIERTWSGGANTQFNTMTICDVAAGVCVNGGSSFDFHMVLDGVPIFPGLGLQFTGVHATPVLGGVRATFIFDTGFPASIHALWVERTVTLYDKAAVFEIVDSLHNDTPTAHRLSSVRLDTLRPESGATVEVHAYSGGSDWRNDFRRVNTQSAGATFDEEGEIARTDDGHGIGLFMVSERRGGAGSRIQYGGTTGTGTELAAGVDYARDLADLGPLATDPPDYNRVENPAYPAPLRGRLIPPFSTFKLGTVATGVYHGGAQNAGVAYADYLARYRQPKFARQVTLNSFHPWSHGADFNDATMRKQADVAVNLGIDTIILDDQWQGGAGGESGDWNWDTVRFPDSNHDGVADIVDHFNSKGIKLGLWMSPAEFHPSSATFAAHPEWSCVPIGTATSQYPDDAGFGVWDFNNAAFRAYMSSVIDRLVSKDGVHYFKFDFQVWTECPPYDYNDYEDAFVGWVDSLEAAHPDVTFEFDETNDQRMWAFEAAARGPSWFDNYHTHTLPDGRKVSKPAQLLHDVWMAAPWIPPSVIGAGTFDGTVGAYDPQFLLAAACLTHWTFWTDLTKLSPGVRAEAGWWIDWYHAHAAELSGGAYELTPDDPQDMSAPAAFEIGGFLFAFRQAGDAPAITLHTPGAQTLRNVRTGESLSYTPGMTLPLGAPNTAAVYEISAV